MTTKYFQNVGISIWLASCAVLCAEGTDTSKTNGKKKYVRPKIAESDPYKISKILFRDKKHTLVPKKAVLFVPKNMNRQVIEFQPKGDFQVWPSFYRKNQAWIYALEVTLDEAKGNKPISPERMEQLSKAGKVIVAVYRHNPISVLSPKPKVSKENSNP